MVGRKQNTIEQFLSPNINIFSFLGKLYNVPGIQILEAMISEAIQMEKK